MDSKRWKQVDSLLLSALERPPGERADFLREACSGDEALEREVRSLLHAQDTAGSFLQGPAMEVAARNLALAESSAESLTGRTVSHYQIVEKLGVGGMGIVWKARDTQLDRFVALKFLPPAMVNDPEQKRRLVQEARTASALNHPNIVTIYEIDQADGADFIAMEYVPGRTLDRLLARKALRLHDAIQYAVQVADALAAAHSAGIVHRDLKPGNVMVADNQCVKVLDFGLAKIAKQSPSSSSGTLAGAQSTAEGAIVGTVSYMSPEQAEGKKVDARSDIFSFGAVLYEMVTGKRAFPGDSIVSILSAILRDDPKPAAAIVAGLPPALDRIIARCIQKDPDCRYQHAGDLKIDLQEVSRPASALKPTSGAFRWWWLAAALTVAAASFTVGLRFHPGDTQPQWNLTRLTSDAGLSSFSALSPDGKLFAYSFNRAGNARLDLYVKQVAGGQPIRLTSDGSGNTTPDFSPNGSKIVFGSNRDGGGIYETPAFGGEIRLLAREGRYPKYSPDGSQVAYWIGGNVAAPVPGSGTVWVVSVASGQTHQVGPNFTAARSPIWSPDGTRLLLVGYDSAKAYENSSIDWWLVDADGHAAIRTGVHEVLMRAGLRPFKNVNSIQPFMPTPGCWSAQENSVAFSAAIGDTQNLWQIRVSARTGKVYGEPKRLTVGAGNETELSCASGSPLPFGALTFTNAETRTDIWSLPYDLEAGKSTGVLERMIPVPANRFSVSLSNQGRYAAFASDQSGRSNIWMRDLLSGKESMVAISSFFQRFAVINPSGTQVAFSSYEENNKRVVYVAVPGGSAEKMCEGCLRATGWSRDEKTLLTFGGSPYQVNLLDIASHRETALLKHPVHHLLYGKFSPDNRWVCFTERTQPNRAKIMLAPVDGPKSVPESAWVTIAEVGPEDGADWSPSGKTLYFTSDRDGYGCLWGQRLDPASRRPVGPAFAAVHLHGRSSFQHGGWSAAGGRIAVVLEEDIGNIWMMSRTGVH